MTSRSTGIPPTEIEIPCWELAWTRTKRDHQKGRTFVTRLFLIDLIERNLGDYLDHLQRRAREGWVPNAPSVCYEPKGKRFVRSGGVLQIDDEVYYNLLVGEMHSAIRDGLAWSQSDPDIAYQLSSSSDDEKWILDWHKSLNRWRELSSERLAISAFMVATDISGCYENIDLQRLSSELRPLGCKP